MKHAQTKKKHKKREAKEGLTPSMPVYNRKHAILPSAEKSLIRWQYILTKNDSFENLVR